MDKQRSMFFGFILGFALLLVPVHPFFFWKDAVDGVETFFHYVGIIFFVICGIALIIDVIKAFTKSK